MKCFALPKVTPTDFSHSAAVLGSKEEKGEPSRLPFYDLRLNTFLDKYSLYLSLHYSVRLFKSALSSLKMTGYFRLSSLSFRILWESAYAWLSDACAGISAAFASEMITQRESYKVFCIFCLSQCTAGLSHAARSPTQQRHGEKLQQETFTKQRCSWILIKVLFFFLKLGGKDSYRALKVY